MNKTYKKQSNTFKKYWLGGKSNISAAELSDDGDLNEDIQIVPINPPAQKQEDYVFRLDNHVYFTTDVTMVNINKLTKILFQLNREFDITKSSITCGELKPTPIYLHLTSSGGDLFAGLRAMDLIESSQIPIYTIVEGYAQSACSLMFLAGKRKFMTENSFILIHQLSSYGENGTYEQLKDSFSNNQVLMDKIIDVYCKKSNGKLTKKKLQDILKHDLFWDYGTCKSYNLVDEMYPKTSKL